MGLVVFRLVLVHLRFRDDNKIVHIDILRVAEFISYCRMIPLFGYTFLHFG